MLYADAIVVGEGEALWPRVVADAERGTLRKIYRNASPGDVTLGHVTPRYDLLRIERYNRMPLQTTRGCPLHCEFCAASRVLGAYKLKPVDAVRREIREIKKWGVEVGLKAQVIQQRRYGWETQLNIASNAGKVVRLNGTDMTIDLGSISHRIGYAPNSFFSYRILSATYDPATRKAINPMCDDAKGGSMPCYNAACVVQAPQEIQIR